MNNHTSRQQSMNAYRRSLGWNWFNPFNPIFMTEWVHSHLPNSKKVEAITRNRSALVANIIRNPKFLSKTRWGKTIMSNEQTDAEQNAIKDTWIEIHSLLRSCRGWPCYMVWTTYYHAWREEDAIIFQNLWIECEFVGEVRYSSGEAIALSSAIRFPKYPLKQLEEIAKLIQPFVWSFLYD